MPTDAGTPRAVGEFSIVFYLKSKVTNIRMFGEAYDVPISFTFVVLWMGLRH